MFDGIPNWGWAILIAQMITLYNVTRLEKRMHSQYTFIMKQLRPDAFKNEVD